MNKKNKRQLERFIAAALDGDWTGVETFESGLRRQFPLADLLAEVKKANFKPHWRLHIDGEEKRLRHLTDLVGHSAKALSKNKLVLLEIWFNGSGGGHVNYYLIGKALRREIEEFEKKQRRPRV